MKNKSIKKVNKKPDYTLLTSPLTLEQQRQSPDGWVSGVVPISINDIFTDFENFLNQLSTLLIGTDMLTSIEYTVVGNDGNELHICVKGDASMNSILESID